MHYVELFPSNRFFFDISPDIMNKYLDYAFHLRILHLKVGKINRFELRFLPLYSTLMNYFNAFYSETIQDPLNQWNFKENGILQAPEEQRKYLKKIPYSLSANRATANHSQSCLHSQSEYYTLTSALATGQRPRTFGKKIFYTHRSHI